MMNLNNQVMLIGTVKKVEVDGQFRGTLTLEVKDNTGPDLININLSQEM